MRTVKLVAASALIGAIWTFLPATGASAHVHLITPLLCTPSDPSVTGANRTDTTPAAAANDGPISGVIPVVRSGGAIDRREGGFDNAACDHLSGSSTDE